jgi:hypothetical protein
MHINMTETRNYRDEHRFACAAELYEFIQTTTTTAMHQPQQQRHQPIRGYMVIHSDFFLAPGFVQHAREALANHPASTWTAGGVWEMNRNDRQSDWAPLEATSAPAMGKATVPWWPWWEVYSDQLNAARGRIAQLFPDLVLQDGDAFAPTSVSNRSHWVDMYFVPAAIADRYAIFARIFKQYRIFNELAVVDSLLLAGWDGRVDGEYNFPCYGTCCESVEAEKLANTTFLERYPCGHKLQLNDPASRSALTAAWSLYASAADDPHSSSPPSEKSSS